METIETAKTFSFNEIVHYEENGIVSKQIIKKSTGNVTLFAFAAGQMLSEHSAPFDALVQVIEGSAEIVIGGTAHNVKAGESIIMPANIPHGVNAHEKFKMLLTMIRSQE